MKKNLLIAGIFFISFLLVTLCMKTGCLESFDQVIASAIDQTRNPFLDLNYTYITKLGDADIVIIFVCLLSIIFNNKNRRMFLSTILISTGLNILCKNMIQRPRPTIHQMIPVTGFSYPSGHAMIAISFFGFLIYWIYKNIHHKSIKIPLIALFSMIILLIGMSRIYLGVHYASDVLGAILLGLSNIICVTTIVNHKKWKIPFSEENLKKF